MTRVSLGQINDFLHPGYVSGRYYFSPNIVNITTSGTPTNLSANQIYYLPVLIGADRQLDRLAVICNTLGMGNIRLGIYTAGSDSLPDILVVGSDNISVASTGTKEISVNANLRIGNWYWLAVATGVACSLNVSVGNALNGIVGMPSVAVSAINGLRANFTFGALPSAAPKTAIAPTANVPVVWFRCA